MGATMRSDTVPRPQPNGEHPLVRALDVISELKADGKAVLAALPMRIVEAEEGFNLIREDEKPTECCVVLRGLVARYKLVAEGQRQILSFHFPGEIPDLQNLYLGVMDHS